MVIVVGQMDTFLDGLFACKIVNLQAGIREEPKEMYLVAQEAALHKGRNLFSLKEYEKISIFRKNCRQMNTIQGRENAN